MTVYFPQNNWEPFAHKRLNVLIDNYKKPAGTPLSEQEFAVFDFDNTSAVLDIEDNLMMYMMDNLLYKLTPAEFYQILTTGPFDLDTPFYAADEPLITANNLATDIIDQYEWLYNHYINQADKSVDRLSEIQKSPQFMTFSAKLRMFYNLYNASFVRQATDPWATYWFANYTVVDFKTMVKEMLDQALLAPFTNRVWSSATEFPGITGIIESSFETGLTFPTELTDLYHALQANNIATYVISASPIDLVRVAAMAYDYNVPESQIIGMCYPVDADGKIVAQIEPETFVTKAPGKVEAIKNLIMTKHHGKEPLAVFGDSTGDYNMMTEFEHTQISLLFNRYMANATQEIVEDAIAQYNQRDARYLLQGRNENTGQLRPYQTTIPIGHTEAVLRASDYKAERSLAE